MTISIKKTEEAIKLLQIYEGNNQYLKILKFNLGKKDKTITDFEIDYVLKNINFQPLEINKVVKIIKWFGEKKQEQWGINFIPEKVLITQLLGETDNTFHVYLKYKQNQEKPVMCFIPKSALLDDFLIKDYQELDIDFNVYNEMLSGVGREVLPHQKPAVQFLLSRKKCLLADDQGLTKTASTIMAALEGKFKKILIVCPASLKTNWCKEIRFFNKDEDIAVIEGENRDNWISDKRFTIINFDIIDSYYTIPTEVVDGKVVKSRKKNVIQEAMSQSNLFTEGFDLLIIDEVHKLSNNSSIRYKVIEDFIKKTKIQYVFLMTGTPVTNDPINLYHILKLIDHPITRDYAYYAKQFCNGFQITKKDTGRKIWITKGSSNEEELKEKIKDVYLRRVKEDIEGMVKKTIHERYYELTDEEKTIYDGLWDEYEQSQNELGNYNLNKDLIEGIFLRQFISNSMVKNTIKLTDEFLEKGKKVLIACCFNDEITQLKEYFGDKAVIYKGGMTSKKKNEAVEKFMDDPNTTVFIGNMIAAGVGLTLTSSNIGIFNSYDWTYYNTIQFVDRLHRVGAKEDVNIYFQLYRNTISEDMWEKVIRKQIMSESIIKKETEK